MLTQLERTRRELGLSMAAFGAGLGISERSIADAENGKIGGAKLARAFATKFTIKLDTAFSICLNSLPQVDFDRLLPGMLAAWSRAGGHEGNGQSQGISAKAVAPDAEGLRGQRTAKSETLRPRAKTKSIQHRADGARRSA